MVVNAQNDARDASEHHGDDRQHHGRNRRGASITRNIAKVNIINAQAALVSGATVAVHATEGVPLVNVPVATFHFSDTTPPSVFGAAADFVATINWGDGTSSAGTIVQLAPDPVTGLVNFQVSGSHTYAEETPTTPPLTPSVTITDKGSTRSFTIGNAPGGVAVTIQDNFPVTLAATAPTVTVADAPLTAQGASIQAVEGQPVGATAPGILVATFTDANPNATVADFNSAPAPITLTPPTPSSVTVDWGDGTISTTTRSRDGPRHGHLGRRRFSSHSPPSPPRLPPLP